MNNVVFKQVLFFIKKVFSNSGWYISIMVLVAIENAVSLSLRPYILKVILNRLTEYPNENILENLKFPVLGYFTLIFVTTTTSQVYRYFIDTQMIPHMRNKIGNYTLGYFLEHSYRYFQNNFPSSLTSKVNDLTNSIPELLQILIDRFLYNILALVIAIYILYQVNIKFALAAMSWSTIFMIFSIIRSKKLRTLSSEWAEYGAMITGKIADILSNILLVKLFAKNDNEKKKFYNISKQGIAAEQKLQKFYLGLWFIYEYSFSLIQGLCLYFLIQGAIEGTISVGDFALVLTINSAIYDFLGQFTKDIAQFSKYLGRITQALSTIITPFEIQDKPNADELIVTHGEIVFDNVKFCYNKNNTPLFKNKSVKILSTQKVGLVGRSGSGKSTFVNLILRLFEISKGRILIDGQDIRSVTQTSLRKSITMISQESIFFHRSIKENICYGKEDATDQEIIEAAISAGAHDFIIKCSEGYNTLIGERVIKLSGG